MTVRPDNRNRGTPLSTPNETRDRPGRAVFISYAHADNENADPAKR